MNTGTFAFAFSWYAIHATVTREEPLRHSRGQILLDLTKLIRVVMYYGHLVLLSPMVDFQ